MQKQEIVLSAADVRRAIVETSISGGFAPLLEELFTPQLSRVGLERRTVYGISVKENLATVYERTVLCDVDKGSPVDRIVEIIHTLPNDEGRRDLLLLGSRYFATADLAQEFATWRDAFMATR